MRRSNPDAIAGSLLLIGAAGLWTSAVVAGQNETSFFMLAVPAAAFLIAGIRQMWRGGLSDE